MSDILEELLKSKREGVAIPAHQAIVDKFVGAVLERDNRFKIQENPVRIADGEEPFKLSEIKILEVTHFEGHAKTFILIETGLVGDEGSMASIFCRNRRQVAITKRGGMTLLNARSKRKSLGWFNCLHSLTKN